MLRGAGCGRGDSSRGCRHGKQEVEDGVSRWRVRGAAAAFALSIAAGSACGADESEPTIAVAEPSALDTAPVPGGTKTTPRRRLPDVGAGLVSNVPPSSVPQAALAVERDVREPPPGTPKSHGEAFRRLPVAVEDRPPVGGVAKSGLHVDRISLGRASAAGRCITGQTKFSIKRHARPTICFRIVHDRIAEEIEVVWQQQQGALRRTELNVPPVHGHRTRTHLVLRPEYVGQWTARVMSDDAVELAAVSFEVTK